MYGLIYMIYSFVIGPSIQYRPDKEIRQSSRVSILYIQTQIREYVKRKTDKGVYVCVCACIYTCMHVPNLM